MKIIQIKLFYLSIPVVFLIFIGCSSIYNATEYTSIKKYYDDFNKSAEGNTLKVTLINDSSLVIPEGAKIKNDSIHLNYFPNYYPLKIKMTKNKFLPLTEVKQVINTNHYKGMAPGIASGLFIGAIIGSTNLIFKYKEDGNHPGTNTGANIFMGGLSGMVIGAIIGAIIGWDNIYQFNH